MTTTKLAPEEIQRRLDLFDAIVIKHPRLVAIHEATVSLLRQSEAIVADNKRRKDAAKGRSFIGREMYVLPIIGPSGATKSTSMRQVIDNINSDPDLPADAIPILYVKMNSNVRGHRQFQAQILAAYGDAGADDVMASAVGWNATLINEAIGTVARSKKTSVIVIDEVHSILAHDGGKVARMMSKAIQSLANDGIFSVILMGTKEAKRLFQVNPELQSRVQAGREISMAEFDIKKQEERGYFFGFVDRLEKQMVNDGVVEESVNLVGDLESRATAYDMAGGVIGIVSRLLRETVILALGKGRTRLTLDDLSQSFAAWNAINGNSGFDPFVKGPQQKTFNQVMKDVNKDPKNNAASAPAEA